MSIELTLREHNAMGKSFKGQKHTTEDLVPLILRTYLTNDIVRGEVAGRASADWSRLQTLKLKRIVRRVLSSSRTQ